MSGDSGKLWGILSLRRLGRLLCVAMRMVPPLGCSQGFCFLSRSEESEAQTGWPASMRESSSISIALHRHAPRGPKHVQCMPRPHPSCSALFRPLTHLGELCSLIPSLPVPLIMKPPLGRGFLDLNAVALTEAVCPMESAPGQAAAPEPRAAGHRAQLTRLQELKPSVLKLECAG